MSKEIWRAVVEVCFIIFLFYANLLMGEFERSARGAKMGLLWAFRDIVTPASVVIALAAGVLGYFVFEFLRRKL